MFFISGAVKHYPWGTTDVIPAILNSPPDGKPWAEYWLGAHPDGPATTEGRRLDDTIAEDPQILGQGSRDAFGDRLPFLVKLLSAATPLSIQAHPNRAQAEAGYSRENASGIAAGSPERSFKDDWPKPELIIALDHFQALAGLRSPARTGHQLNSLGVHQLKPVVDTLIQAKGTGESTRQAFLAVFRQATPGMVTALAGALDGNTSESPEDTLFRETARMLTTAYPRDPSVLAALMLNRVQLHQGEALFVPAGNLHSYLEGTGLEVMGSSDNVVRAGLTGKHVDLAALTEIGDFQPAAPRVLTPVSIRDGLLTFQTPAPEFRVWLIRSPGQQMMIPGSDRGRILVGLRSELTARGTTVNTLARGGALFVPAGEELTVQGTGEAALICSGHGSAPLADTSGSPTRG